MDEKEKIGFTPPKKHTPHRTNLEQYMGVTIQMLMAREDAKDDTPYLDKLDKLYEPLTQDERDFLDKLGEDWATHKWCGNCQTIQPKGHECS